ncbi:MAG: ATP-binding protein, partial [Anaerolineae bacterium]
PVAKQFQVRCTLPEEALFVFGDENRLHQVFYNLVSNAIKYTPEGERITLGLSRRADEVYFWVENTGSGITPEDQQHLFQPYYRTSDRERLNKQGSGLGLYIVQQIVEAHGGRIEVDSQPQHHTRFTVHLPLYDPSQQEPL